MNPINLRLFKINKDNINYYDYRKYYEQNIISPIVSTLGYVIPYSSP
jgi:hypothetical protein